MKSTVVKGNPNKNYTFPRVMEWDCDEIDKKAKGVVVMFFDEREGVCLHSASSGYSIGTKILWTSINHRAWIPFTGTVTIEV